MGPETPQKAAGGPASRNPTKDPGSEVEGLRKALPDLGGDYCECCDPDEKWCRNRVRV